MTANFSNRSANTATPREQFISVLAFLAIFATAFLFRHCKDEQTARDLKDHAAFTLGMVSYIEYKETGGKYSYYTYFFHYVYYFKGVRYEDYFTRTEQGAIHVKDRYVVWVSSLHPDNHILMRNKPVPPVMNAAPYGGWAKPPL